MTAVGQESQSRPQKAEVLAWPLPVIDHGE